MPKVLAASKSILNDKIRQPVQCRSAPRGTKWALFAMGAWEPKARLHAHKHLELKVILVLRRFVGRHGDLV